MRSPVTLGVLMLLAGLDSAHAAGGFWCDIEDQTLKFHFSAATSRSGGGPFRLESTLEVFDKAAPKEFQAFQFKLDDMIEHWRGGRGGGSLKVHFFQRGTPKVSFDSVRLMIDAPVIDEASFKGRYTLTIHPKNSAAAKDPFEASGSVSCSAD